MVLAIVFQLSVSSRCASISFYPFRPESINQDESSGLSMQNFRIGQGFDESLINPMTAEQFNFQPAQIVFLEHDASRLYAEVVQFVESRQLCWVRPIALVTSSDWSWTDYDRLTLQNLQDGSDLMCPAVLFREALDVEVLPLLDRLYQLEAESKSRNSQSHRHLHQFIQQIWQARPDLFENRAN